MDAVLVVAGAAVGAPLRYTAGHYLDGRFPLGTLLVNVVGAFLLGLFAGLTLDGHLMALLGTGFCGALTTYSALTVKSVELGRVTGTAYALGTVLLALGAAQAGFVLA
ncbi:fluoride efflux transporter FluC [Nocardioides jejuensis]|uniref:Fluoride-specific ion channel FluC n=1 Tax=Nocardioides jejuensis TaxID=2502782 RepID=A0A4R1BXX0_9ACTN|nr:CrcB family protein [Nocardioides jejuensis]TCJ22893.1 fluoride efflux transporter CrcB [Nocardioides jejuensis]